MVKRLASPAHRARTFALAERWRKVRSLSAARMIEIDNDDRDRPLLGCCGNSAFGQRQPSSAGSGHVSPGVGPDRQMHSAMHPVRSSLHLDGMATTAHAQGRQWAGCRSNRDHIVQAELEPVGRAAVCRIGTNSHPVRIVKAVADAAFLLRNPAFDDPTHAKHGDGLALSPGRWFRSEALQCPITPRLFVRSVDSSARLLQFSRLVPAARGTRQERVRQGNADHRRVGPDGHLTNPLKRMRRGRPLKRPCPVATRVGEGLGSPPHYGPPLAMKWRRQRAPESKGRAESTAADLQLRQQLPGHSRPEGEDEYACKANQDVIELRVHRSETVSGPEAEPNPTYWLALSGHWLTSRRCANVAGLASNAPFTFGCYLPWPEEEHHG
jgi:hypothetical protein